jgi:hypothetical protein
MFFFFPMWDNLSQKIGKQKCTPFGFMLHSLASSLGAVGFLLLLVLSLYLGYSLLSGNFHRSLLWLLSAPFGMGLLAQIMYMFSWHLADKRGFEYDYDRREASWLENGTRITYHWSQDDVDAYPAEKEKF